METKSLIRQALEQQLAQALKEGKSFVEPMLHVEDLEDILHSLQVADKSLAAKDLASTYAGMVSADYKERFLAEYAQTKIRYEKLKHFCNLIEAADIVGSDRPVHDCPLPLLRQQQRSMGEYLHHLEIRAVIEEIPLPF